MRIRVGKNVVLGVALVLAGSWAADVTLDIPKVTELNVVALGAKNDGSADVSDLVNEQTAKGTLYFPAGIYKVAKPLWLKNPIRGAGYARVPTIDGTRTWLVSAIACTNASVGVLNFEGKVRVNVENLNIQCASVECGIRIAKCEQSTMTFIDKVGIYGLRGTGLYVEGRGSRPIFAQNMTIFGARDYPEQCVGVHMGGPADCRLSNIEAMGVRVGLVVRNGYTYGDNMHLWTGTMAGTDNGRWWKGTRGIVLEPGGVFSGSEIYPDTCFYAIEQRADNCAVSINNVMYWEDGSIKVAPDREGAFFHAPPGVRGTLSLNGGLIGVTGNDAKEGWMRHVYSPGQNVCGVLVKSAYAIKNANLERLCVGGALPDYTVDYAVKGWCKVADIFTRAKTGACRGVLALDTGAAWEVNVVKGASGKVDVAVKPLNALCEGREVKTREVEGVVRVYVHSEAAEPFSARFTTTYMGPFFRPVDHASLRNMRGNPRYYEVLHAL